MREEVKEFVSGVLKSDKDFPKEALIGQALLESGWLRYVIGKYNVFGIKYNPTRHKGYVLVDTHEYFTPEELSKWLSDSRFPARALLSENPPKASGKRVKVRVRDYFADYESLDEAIDDYIRIINSPRYKPAFDAWLQDKDWKAFVRRISPIYATDPNYAQKVINVAERALGAVRSDQSALV